VSPDEARARAVEAVSDALYDHFGDDVPTRAASVALSALLSERQEDGSPLVLLAPVQTGWQSRRRFYEMNALDAQGVYARQAWAVYRAPHQEDE
jgi:hypothetical protein